MSHEGLSTGRGPSGAPEAPPVLLLLGFLPSVVVAVRVIDALWMAAGVLVVMISSAVARSFLRSSASPARDDTGSWLRALVISSLLTAAFEALLMAIAPRASAALGIYAPLIAVNLLVVGTGTEAAPPLRSALAALGRGAWYAVGLVMVALVREVIGAGTITLFPAGDFGGTIVMPALLDQPVRALGLAGGGLLCLGYLAAAVRCVSARKSERAR